MNAKQISEISNVSVRTLHHYDTIGLLSPSRNPENGYREYSVGDLDTLQQILFFRACGFSLASIRTLINRPDFDRQQAFEMQRKALEQEKLRIEEMLLTLDKSMKSMKGLITMQLEEKFVGFNFSSNPYEDEARKRWGDTAIDQSKVQIEKLSPKVVEDGMNALFQKLATVKDEDPESEVAQTAIANMYAYFNANFGYHYSYEAFAQLGEAYEQDKRFAKNIDEFGRGLSAFLSKAMRIFADSHL